jgi:DNA-binding protein YbaB
MGELMRQAARMQRKIDQTKAEVGEREVAIDRLDGKVKVVVTLGRQVRRIEVDKAVLQSEDTELVLDAVCAAINQGLEQAGKEMEAAIDKVTGGVKIPGML